MLAINLLFYFFATITVVSALAVVLFRHPVHAVLSLIVTFFSAAGLLILLGAEFVAYALVIVYVGAVAVLFLFVVMMLHVDVAALRQGFVRHIAFALLVVVVLGIDCYLVLSDQPFPPVVAPRAAAYAADANTVAIGRVLYTEYALSFQMCGLLLLVAMIGAIVLTMRQREGVKRQALWDQLARRRDQGVRLMQPKTGEGVRWKRG
jgi:NADH-quinone oxidoreductase subunit J